MNTTKTPIMQHPLAALVAALFMTIGLSACGDISMSESPGASYGSGPGGGGGVTNPTGGPGTEPGSGPGQETKDGAKVRSYFPETLLAAPFVETDDQGRATLDLQLADSITTWRATVVANGLDGQYGATTFGVKVFQPFFIDLDLPVEVTRGDTVSVPVVVYNYEEGPLEVSLTVEAAEGLTLLGDSEQSVTVQPREVKALRVPVRAETVGQHALTVKAQAGTLADAVKRDLRVVPDGRRVEVVQSGRLDADATVGFEIPQGIVEGSAKVLLKLFPGKAALNSDSAATILRQPSGCFEQTTASAWPNVMALEALEGDPDADPNVLEQARTMVSMGYQRILTFQDAQGGFSWWGDGDTSTMAVTAIGLLQLVDTAKVHDVDATAIELAATWLAGRQGPDGSFAADTYLHCGNEAIGDTDLRMTAYIAGALAYADREPQAVEQAVTYLHAQADDLTDPYTISLALMALGESNLRPEFADELKARLQPVQAQDGSIEGQAPTMYYAYGDQGTIEHTAVGGLAMLATGGFGAAAKAAEWVSANRQGSWGYGSTQSTVQALKLINNTAGGAKLEEDLNVTIRLDGNVFTTKTITPATADVMRQFDLSNLATAGEHALEIGVSVESPTAWELIVVHHEPWAATQAPESHLSLDVQYDSQELVVGDQVAVTMHLSTTQDEAMPMVELGIPPGFTLQPAKLDLARAEGRITRYEVKNNRVVLYFDAVTVEAPISLQYALTATMEVEGTVPSSLAYPYYNPTLRKQTASFPISVVAP